MQNLAPIALLNDLIKNDEKPLGTGSTGNDRRREELTLDEVGRIAI
jgi:hypothetical protein